MTSDKLSAVQCLEQFPYLPTVVALQRYQYWLLYPECPCDTPVDISGYTLGYGVHFEGIQNPDGTSSLIMKVDTENSISGTDRSLLVQL